MNQPAWYAVRVRSNFEKTAAAFLDSQQFGVFLPTYRTRRRWADRVKELDGPLFPGYVFCNFDHTRPLLVLQAPGVVHIVSIGSNPVPVDEAELSSVRRLTTHLHERLEPWPFLTISEKIRIVRGALTGVDGLLIEVKTRSRIVVSVSLLQRSVSAEIDRDDVEPLRASSPATALPVYLERDRRI